MLMISEIEKVIVKEKVEVLRSKLASDREKS
jgi:hypothetical protein